MGKGGGGESREEGKGEGRKREWRAGKEEGGERKK